VEALKGQGALGEEMVNLRNSKLTEALKGALAGNSHTVVLLAVQPGGGAAEVQETTRTLQFGVNASQVSARG
jgi:hypothetical protein